MIEQAELFGNAPGMLPTFEALEGTQPRGLTTLNTPVLLLWGTKDVILLPRQGRRFERLIPGAELRYLKGLGHTPMSDDPELLSEAIEEFALRRSPVQPAAAPA
jgi:pimeloyl-ACP methyl ester carboxylesterase